MQIQFFDRREEHVKMMAMEDYAQCLDRFWRSSRITMTNHPTGKSTVLVWSDYAFGTNPDARDFTRTVLQRVR